MPILPLFKNIVLSLFYCKATKAIIYFYALNFTNLRALNITNAYAPDFTQISE